METFDDYAIDKVALMQQLDLPVPDVINLLIGGISNNASSNGAFAPKYIGGAIPRNHAPRYQWLPAVSANGRLQLLTINS